MGSGEKQREKKKIPVWGRILLVFVIVIVLAVGAVAGVAWHTLGKISHVDQAGNEPVVAPENETFEESEDLSQATGQEMQPEDVQWPEDAGQAGAQDAGSVSDKNVTNIMLIGQDRRAGEGRQRSDTMILVTINKSDKTIKMTSFMRDLYVQIPGYSDNRMNAAYQFGGMPLLDQTLEKNFGIHVDGNIEVDFSGFQTIIDLLGGVDIELTQAEADYICGRDQNVLYPQQRREEWDYLTAGVNCLNGEQALIHARNRSVGHSDYRRTERQRDVLNALFQKATSAGLPTMLSVADDVFSLLTTDMSKMDILKWGTDVMTMGVSQVESYRIPQDGAYYDAIIRRMEVLVPDLTACRSYLDEKLFGGNGQ